MGMLSDKTEGWNDLFFTTSIPKLCHVRSVAMPECKIHNMLAKNFKTGSELDCICLISIAV